MLEDIENTTYSWNGIDPMKAIEIQENRNEAREALKTIMSALTEKQKKILLLSDYSVAQVSQITGINPSEVIRTRNTIPKRLYKYTDEDRIANARNTEDKQKRIAVRNALKTLYTLLLPPQSTKEMNGHVSQPAFSFERFKEVNMGMREGITRGRTVMKTISKCMLPEYFRDTFADDKTICTLCPHCKHCQP